MATNPEVKDLSVTLDLDEWVVVLQSLALAKSTDWISESVEPIRKRIADRVRAERAERAERERRGLHKATEE